MAGLLDFLQSASNASASTVSGPVDMLSWLLQKAGVPVGNAPPGSSAWMEQKGLTKPVKQSAASLAGETVGLLSPTVAAAKAPQIAKGLLQVADNAAAPSLLRNDKGAIVWHGSPHKFDKFDSSKIGTGEGAQAYGHGLYLAESPDVGGQYARMNLTGPANVAHVASRDGGDAIAALKRVYPGMPREWYESAVRKSKDAGNLYKVDLPDNAIARMLDWDKPLYRQKPEVRKAVRAVVDESTSPGTYAQWVRGARPDMRSLQNDMLDGMDNAEIAQMLRAKGIPGVRYLDGGSRGAGSGTSNFVVFPGEEGLLKILERNGQGL